MANPSLLAYPEVLTLDELPELQDQLIYVVRAYPLNGLAVMIHREDGGVTIQIGDWDGQALNPQENPVVQKFLDQSIQRLVTVMKHSGIDSALFYVTYQDDEFRLVDIRTALNKLVVREWSETYLARRCLHRRSERSCIWMIEFEKRSKPTKAATRVT